MSFKSRAKKRAPRSLHSTALNVPNASSMRIAIT